MPGIMRQREQAYSNDSVINTKLQKGCYGGGCVGI